MKMTYRILAAGLFVLSAYFSAHAADRSLDQKFAALEKDRASIQLLRGQLDKEIVALGQLQAQLNMMTGAGGKFKVSSAAPTLALDGVSNVKIALSSRKLRTAYAGAPLQVIRASDSATQDIPFLSDVLDTANLGTFCSGTTCTIKIWYDQSGNANDCTPFFSQPLEGPIIYSSGAVKVINTTRPATLWNQSASPTYRLQCVPSANPVNTLYTSTVSNLTNAVLENIVTGSQLSGGFEFNVITNTSNLVIQKLFSGGFASSTGAVTLSTAGVYENSYEPTGGAWAFWIDGSASGTGTSVQTFSAANMAIGNGGGGAQKADGLIGEIIQIDQVGSFAGRASLQANQKAYWGTP